MPEKPEESALNAHLLQAAEIQGLPALNTENSDWIIQAVPDIDWLAHSYQKFQPFSVGPFFIYGGHYEGKVPDAQIGLQIDAATAFGSGEHGTTKGCLQAILDLNDDGVCPWNVLDMGTGSGILGIAAWKVWKTPVLAVDIDEEPVRVACRHRDINKVPDGKTGMICEHGDGFESEIVKKRAPYDLIIANILAETLKVMAEDLKEVSDDNGHVILSGILIEQRDSVLEVYEPLGFRLEKFYELDDWVTLVLRKT